MNYTIEQLYEQVKAGYRELVLQHGLLDEGDLAFLLQCHDCGLPFRNDVEIGLVVEHQKMEHGREKPMLDLVYIGKGMPPKPRE